MDELEGLDSELAGPGRRVWGGPFGQAGPGGTGDGGWAGRVGGAGRGVQGASPVDLCAPSHNISSNSALSAEHIT